MDQTQAIEVGRAERVRGFVDVLGTCDRWPSLEQDPSGGGEYLSNRRRLPLPEGPITLEMARLPARAAGEGVLPGDEFVLVVEGEVSFQQADIRLSLSAGQAGVVLRDRRLSWQSNRGGKLIVMRCTGGGGPAGDMPVRIDQNAPLSPSNPPLPQLLIGPTPQCRGHTDYRSQSGEFACGTWDSTPYRRQIVMFRHYELMRLLSGSVTFVDSTGREGRFGIGDIVLFEQGGSASWNSDEYVKKIYCTFRPA